MKLATLFAFDSLGSGLAVQTLIAYWLHWRFDADVGLLGTIFATNVVAGLSALSAPTASAGHCRCGRTSPATSSSSRRPHADAGASVAAPRSLSPWRRWMSLRARATRCMIVDEDERSAASAVTNQAKLVGTTLGPLLAGLIGLLK